MVEHIGKEANRWEEQFYVGLDHNAQTEYGIGPEDTERILDGLRAVCERLGQRAVARAARVSLREVSAVVNGERVLAPTTLRKLSRAAAQLEAADREQAKRVQDLLETVRERCQHVGMRNFAAQAGVDAANLSLAS